MGTLPDSGSTQLQMMEAWKTKEAKLLTKVRELPRLRKIKSDRGLLLRPQRLDGTDQHLSHAVTEFRLHVAILQPHSFFQLSTCFFSSIHRQNVTLPLSFQRP
jgi:hypothetical protein